MSLNNYMPRENRKRQKLYTAWEQNKEKYKSFKTLCGTQSKNFHTKVRKVSLENTTTWKIKSLTSSLNLYASNKLAQITALEATKMKQKSTMTLSRLEWHNCEKCEKMSTSLECVCCHEIPAVKVSHLKFKARLSWNTAVLEFFTVEFNCVRNCFLEESFSEIFLKLFLSISFNLSKMTPFRYFAVCFVFIAIR